MTLPVDRNRWPLNEREEWDERAGQIQFDGAGCTRAESERRAEAVVRRRVELAERVVYPAHRAATG